MSYKNDSELVILNKYGKAEGFAKAELYETWDRLRDLTISGPSINGSGVGKFASFLTQIARTVGSTAFSPSLGSEAISVPGTSYYSPISGGAGVVPGGQAAFGLAPFSQFNGFPSGGAAPVQASQGRFDSILSQGFAVGGASPVNNPNSSLGDLDFFASSGIGAVNRFGESATSYWGIGDTNFPDSSLIGGSVIGGATSLPAISSGAIQGAQAAGLGAGVAAGAGFGRNWVMPAAGVVSGIGGLLTTLGPFFGPFGIAGAAAGSILSGGAGAVLHSFQHVSNRILANADVVLSNKVKNLETTSKMLGAQQDILKKLLKGSIDGDKKALDNI